jgi:D-threo-aldose 1-dehydrogenase
MQRAGAKEDGMRTVQVPGISFSIPVLGFGCSSLTSVDEKKAQRLLAATFDAGVRHFDVARYYGYGEAEGRLGRFVKSRRNEITITTKFGIEPPRRTSAMRLAMAAARRLVQLVPASRSFLRSRAQGTVKSGAFGVQEARTSLDTSLRELGTDHIDFYLLHDYVVSGDSPHELLEFLNGAVQAGKIRYFGLGTGIENIRKALESQPELCEILQFENSVLARNLETLPARGPQRLTITHSALSGSFQSLSAFLKAHPEVVHNWTLQLGVDCSRDETISALLLNYSVRMNANGLVLFSSRDASRVRANVAAVLEPGISDTQVELFGQLAERDVTPEIPAVRN